MLSDYLQTVDWSRAQFAMTAIYHWLFVPLTLGLGFIIAIMETLYVRTGDEFWKRTTKFWMRLFGINFAIGVATGLILEFEFGTNWSNYSHFVGDIFGAPLAIEGILAFFLESTFIAVMFFGWRKVSRGFHLTATWLTAFGANLSAWWILVANSWMQYPVGCDFNLETVRNEMTSFSAVALSPVAVNKFFHTVTSSFVLAALFVVGVSAWYLLRRREQLMARRGIAIASAFGFVFALVTAFTGDRSGAIVARVQPMKLAAMEALYNGEEGAPLTVVGLLRPEGQRTCDDDAFYFKIGIPKLLSLMSFRSANAFVPGINDLVYGNEERGILSTAEKMSRGRHAIDQLGRYHEAREKGDEAAMHEVERLFDASTPEGAAFLRDYYAYYKTPRGYHERSLNSNEGWNVTSALSFLNMPIRQYSDEIRSAVLVVHGEKAHSCYFSRDAFAKLRGENKELMIIPSAVHTDLYDRKDIIPFDKLESFFRQYLT